VGPDHRIFPVLVSGLGVFADRSRRGKKYAFPVILSAAIFRLERCQKGLTKICAI
jgi:hypothetical protein